jgi:glycosyltransferase involved in cell wall biosynthesis
MTSLALIVVPCYNEEKRLAPEAFREFVGCTRAQIRFLFVDDGSTDGTWQRLEELRASCPGAVEIHRLASNCGKAEAVRQGMLKALESQAEYVGFWDADLATPLEAIPAFCACLAEHPRFDMVFGARVQLLGREIERRALRHYLGRVFSTAVSLVLKLKVYDTQCGAKLFRASPQLGELFAAPFLSPWLFDVEILARLIQRHRRTGARPPTETVCEYPLPRWRDVRGSKVRGGDFFTAAFDLFRIYLKYLRSNP